MYKLSDKLKSSFLDFNRPMGLHMNSNNRWIKMADSIPWDVFEKKYKILFKVKTGNVAKPLRTALGALIIQTKFQYSDRELVEQITENPYLQYFIGLPDYQEEPPFDPSTMVLFRKRINAQVIAQANEYILLSEEEKQDEDDDHSTPPTRGGTEEAVSTDNRETENEGTLILDASCAPVNIRYPQDVSLLNERDKSWKRFFTVFTSLWSGTAPSLCQKST